MPAEGAYASSPGVPLDKMPGGKAFTDKYKAKYNIDIQIYAPYAYDAANVLLEAMKKAGFHRSGQVPAGAGRYHLPGRDRQRHLRRERRHQRWQHQPVPGQGRQVGVSRYGRRLRVVSDCEPAASPRPLQVWPSVARE